MSYKLSLKTVLIMDAAMVACCLLLAYMFPGIRQNSANIAAIFALFFFFHAFIVPFKGFDFYIWDAPDNSWVKIYWFVSIAPAVALSQHLLDAVWGYLFLE